jgi:type II secretory pathway pseudopilin PulG
MFKKRTIKRKGFTLIELVIAAAFLAMVTLCVGVALVSSHRGWNALYNRISGVVTDADIARRTFDRLIRKSSKDRILLDETGSWVEVLYYQDSTSTYLDRYARLYRSDNELEVEYGSIDAEGYTSELLTQTLCSNVSSCVFTSVGGSIEMVLILDNGSETATVVSSAVAHN